MDVEGLLADTKPKAKAKSLSGLKRSRPPTDQLPYDTSPCGLKRSRPPTDQVPYDTSPCGLKRSRPPTDQLPYDTSPCGLKRSRPPTDQLPYDTSPCGLKRSRPPTDQLPYDTSPGFLKAIGTGSPLDKDKEKGDAAKVVDAFLGSGIVASKPIALLPPAALGGALLARDAVFGCAASAVPKQAKVLKAAPRQAAQPAAASSKAKRVVIDDDDDDVDNIVDDDDVIMDGEAVSMHAKRPHDVIELGDSDKEAYGDLLATADSDDEELIQDIVAGINQKKELLAKAKGKAGTGGAGASGSGKAKGVGFMGSSFGGASCPGASSAGAMSASSGGSVMIMDSPAGKPAGRGAALLAKAGAAKSGAAASDAASKPAAAPAPPPPPPPPPPEVECFLCFEQVRPTPGAQRASYKFTCCKGESPALFCWSCLINPGMVKRPVEECPACRNNIKGRAAVAVVDDDPHAGSAFIRADNAQAIASHNTLLNRTSASASSPARAAAGAGGSGSGDVQCRCGMIMRAPGRVPCPTCLGTWYCSNVCLADDKATHKKFCKARGAAGAGGSASAGSAASAGMAAAAAPPPPPAPAVRGRGKARGRGRGR